MTVHEGAWAEIRRCYEETDEPIAKLLKRFSVTAWALRCQREKEAWTARPAVGTKLAKKSKTKTRKPAAKAASRTAGKVAIARAGRTVPDTLDQRIQRILKIIDQELDNLETLMTGKRLSAEDEAKKSRHLHTILTNLEKVTDLAKAAAGPNKPLSAAERANRAEQLRREIAERLERLNAQWSGASSKTVSEG